MVTDRDLDRAFAPNPRPTTGTLQPIPFPNVAEVGGVGVSGARQTAGSVSTGQGQRTQIRAPRRSLSPTATNTEDTALARTQRALAIRQSMNELQGGRGEVESKANDQIGEALRLSLNEQRRAQQSLRELDLNRIRNPVETRIRREALAAATDAVTTNMGAVRGIREGEVTRAGQLTAADTTLQDRRMQEAGAFGRAQINLDVAETQGRFGLEQQALANQGAADARTALNPLEMERLRLGRAFENQFADQGGTLEEQRQLGFGLFDAYGGQGQLSGFGGPGELQTITIPNPDGSGPPIEVSVSSDIARRYGEAMAIKSAPWLLEEIEAQIRAQKEQAASSEQRAALINAQRRE